MLIQAIYENGMLRLLDDVDLQEGQRVGVMIQPEISREEVRAKLKAAGILATVDPPENYQPLSDEEFERLAKLFSSDRLTSEDINEDRGEY